SGQVAYCVSEQSRIQKTPTPHKAAAAPAAKGRSALLSLQAHQPGFGLREHVALLSRPRPSAIHHPATHFPLTSRCPQRRIHPDHVPRQTQGKRPVHSQPDMFATAADPLDPTTEKLETGPHLSGTAHGRVLPDTQTTLAGMLLVLKVTLQQTGIGWQTDSETQPTHQQPGLDIGSAGVKQMTERATVPVLRLRTNDHAQLRAADQTLQLPTRGLGIGLGRLTVAPHLRCIDPDQSHTPTIGQIQGIAINDTLARYHLAGVRLTAVFSMDRRSQ